MKIKIVVSFSIFLLLLSAAWFLQQQQNRQEFNVKTMDSGINNLNVVPMNNEMTPLKTNVSTENSNVQWKLYMPFRAREYVRIIAHY
jgi:hypothetical protein